MKKLLLSSAAVLGLAIASPALAQDDSALSLDIGGHYKGYVSYIDQDDIGDDVNDVDWLQETELHLQGETTLDNGLTVGAHIELEVDGGDDSAVDESYAYFSGMWGRINAGNEDGAAYLLQVAAPAADDNVDGIRQYVTGFNSGGFDIDTDGDGADDALGVFDGLDYDNDIANNSNKLTYLTPIFAGFQAGASYTPDVSGTSLVDSSGNPVGASTNAFGNGFEDEDLYNEAYEVAARYEGAYNNVGFIAGAGYSFAEAGTAADDFDQWNVGLDLDMGPFGLGAVYTEADAGTGAATETDTIVVGADYTTGPFKLGASYLNLDNDAIEADRYTGGVVYTYGPGMSFRGSVSYIDAEAGGDDADGTNVLLGTQVNF
ncbi:MAG: porin [Micavibrio sp.]|nr:porin [Micavibrio sp.]